MKEKTKSLTTPILVVLLVMAAFLVGSLWTKNQALEKGQGSSAPTGQPSAQQQTLTLEQIRNAFSKSLVKFGKVDSKLVLVEVSDPSCPFCQIAGGHNGELNKEVDKSRGSQTFTLVADGGTYIAPVPEMKKLVDSGKAAFTFLYFPGHGNGEMGVKAFYCAFEKGKYWEVHDRLMTSEGYDLLNNTVKNDKTKSGELADFLKPVFDPTVMKDCLDSGKYDSRLKDDEAVAGDLMTIAAGPNGRPGTPGFFANTTFFGGAYSYKDMEAAVTNSL